MFCLDQRNPTSSAWAPCASCVCLSIQVPCRASLRPNPKPHLNNRNASELSQSVCDGEGLFCCRDSKLREGERRTSRGLRAQSFRCSGKSALRQQAGTVAIPNNSNNRPAQSAEIGVVTGRALWGRARKGASSLARWSRARDSTSCLCGQRTTTPSESKGDGGSPPPQVVLTRRIHADGRVTPQQTSQPARASSGLRWLVGALR